MKTSSPYWTVPVIKPPPPGAPYWEREAAAKRADEHLKLLKRIEARLDAVANEVARSRLALEALTKTAEKQRANEPASAALDIDLPLI